MLLKKSEKERERVKRGAWESKRGRERAREGERERDQRGGGSGVRALTGVVLDVVVPLAQEGHQQGDHVGLQGQDHLLQHICNTTNTPQSPASPPRHAC